MGESGWNPENLPQILGRTIEDALTNPLIDPIKNNPSAINLAGIADSRLYVTCEWILDKFAQRYPKIPTKKLSFSEFEWPAVLDNMTKLYGWSHTDSVLFYREALGTPILYIGGLQPFRMYLKQLYSFSCALIPDALLEGHITDNRAELVRAEQLRSIQPEPEDTWKVAIISTNQLEAITLNLIYGFGTQQVMSGGKPVELTIHNTTAKLQRSNFNWEEKPIADYVENNRWKLTYLKDMNYLDSLYEAVNGKDLIIILWSMREEMQDALEGRTYSLREGMDEQLITFICEEIAADFGPYVTALEKVTNLTNTRIVLASNRFKTPLSAVGTYLLQKVTNLPPGNLFGNPCSVDRGYRSIIAEELNVRTVDVTNTAVWGNLGGTILMDPTAALVTGHQGVIDAPRSVILSRPLLQIFSDARKLQVDFSVDNLRRINYMEMLEGPRCASVLVSETTIELIKRWSGAFRKPSAEKDWLSVAIVTSLENGPSVVPGYFIIMPICFSGLNGCYEVLNQNNREEIRVILKKATAELSEFLTVMRKNVDHSLSDSQTAHFPAISVISETDSQTHLPEPEILHDVIEKVAEMAPT